MRIISAIFVITLLVSACKPHHGSNSGVRKQDIGTVAGALGGAFAGANLGKGKGKVLGIAAGTLLGAFIGNEIGASLDRADMAYYNATSQNALEKTKTNAKSEWVNPDTGNRGTFTPTQTYKAPSGNYCREFTQTITVGGRTEEAYGTACRQPDGSWKLAQK